MKIIRSSRCSLKFATQRKRDNLSKILAEYAKVVNSFIRYFWINPDIHKIDLLKPIVDFPKDSWLSFSLRQTAAREALDMISASKERDKDKAVRPTHHGKRMRVSSNVATLVPTEDTPEFNAWLHLGSMGDKNIDLPIKYHKHFNKLAEIGKRLNSYVITENDVQFCFEITAEPKREGTHCIGIDTGINALASLDNGHQYGLDIKECIERVKRCNPRKKSKIIGDHFGKSKNSKKDKAKAKKHCTSEGQKTARRALKQRIDEVAKEIIMKENPDLIVVERLENMGHGSKVKGRLTQNIRRSIGIWNWKYWLKRVESQCELNCVSFRTVAPYNTSIICPECNKADRRSRKGEVFKCTSCGHTANADVNAGRNILNRFLTGLYGARYKKSNSASDTG